VVAYRCSIAGRHSPSAAAVWTRTRVRSCVGWTLIPTALSRSSQRVREAGFTGGVSILKDYVRQIRPPKQKAFLKLSFAAGEAAQVDWGEYGTIAVGGTRRKLSFFLMVLCHSRMMYLEFTVSQTMEHFPRLPRARICRPGRAREDHP